MKLSPQSKDVNVVVDECKKAQRREQNRINQTNYRKRQRQCDLTTARTLQLSPTLSGEQAEALMMAIQTCTYASTVLPHRSKIVKEGAPSVPPKDMNVVASEELKKVRREQPRTNEENYRKLQFESASGKTLQISSSLNADQTAALSMALGEGGRDPWKQRRREQTRFNQANYRKRQHAKIQRIPTEIKALEKEIEQLETYNEAIRENHRNLSVQFRAIRDFYCALRIKLEKQQLPDVSRYRQIYGCSPALENLLDLQREEFDSVDSLKLHWMWYRTQFRVFSFSVRSCQRLEVGEHVIVKATGELRLDVYSNVPKGTRKKEGCGTIVCPVLQQLEFDSSERLVTRITSEVDLVGGVAAVQNQNDPESMLEALQRLADDFCISNQGI